MSLPQSTIEALAEYNDPAKKEVRKWIAEVDRLNEAIQKLRDEKADLELANATLRRRVESLEADR